QILQQASRRPDLRLFVGAGDDRANPGTLALRQMPQNVSQLDRRTLARPCYVVGSPHARIDHRLRLESMCDFQGRHGDQAFGFLVDASEIRALVDETMRFTAAIADTPTRVEALKPAFAKLLAAEGWLPHE